jgi:hypothetical protein
MKIIQRPSKLLGYDIYQIGYSIQGIVQRLTGLSHEQTKWIASRFQKVADDFYEDECKAFNEYREAVTPDLISQIESLNSLLQLDWTPRARAALLQLKASASQQLRIFNTRRREYFY